MGLPSQLRDVWGGGGARDYDRDFLKLVKKNVRGVYIKKKSHKLQRWFSPATCAATSTSCTCAKLRVIRWWSFPWDILQRKLPRCLKALLGVQSRRLDFDEVPEVISAPAPTEPKKTSLKRKTDEPVTESKTEAKAKKATKRKNFGGHRGTCLHVAPNGLCFYLDNDQRTCFWNLDWNKKSSLCIGDVNEALTGERSKKKKPQRDPDILSTRTTVPYFPAEDEKGRVYGGFRRLLCHSVYHDVDLVNAQPSLFQQVIAKAIGAQLTPAILTNMR